MITGAASGAGSSGNEGFNRNFMPTGIPVSASAYLQHHGFAPDQSNLFDELFGNAMQQ